MNTDDPVRTGGLISFTIRITNTGNVPITTLPLIDTYEANYLAYEGATPQSDDNISDGTINWSDLTAAAPNGFGQDLAPGASFAVVVEFTALRDTTSLPNGATINTATVTGAEADPDGPGGAPAQPLPSKSDDAPVRISAPTAVAISQSSLTTRSGEVEIRWQTINETNILQFNLYRVSDNASTLVISIPAARNGQPKGHAYLYRDLDVARGLRYTYWLEIISPVGGVSTVELGQIYAGGVQIFLPLTQR